VQWRLPAVIFQMTFPPFIDALFGNFIGSAAGALAGAVAVLLYEAWRRNSEHVELQHSKLLRAQLILADKINSITNLKNMLDQIPKETDAAMVSKMLYTMVDEHLSTRDLEPMITGQWADQAAEILRCDRSYRDAADSLAQFNQEKNRITSHPDTNVVDFDLKARQMGANVNVPLLLDLNSAWTNLRESVDQCHRRLHQALDSSGAFMKQTYPGRRTISVSPKKETS
jgi:hemoglobin-like flavoprotein